MKAKMSDELNPGRKLRYTSQVPRKLPKGRVLVHNHIAHTKDMPSGVKGFRFWTQKAEPERLVLCKCGWQGLTHYHVNGLGSHKSFTPAQLEKLLGEEPGSYAEFLGEIAEIDAEKAKRKARRMAL